MIFDEFIVKNAIAQGRQGGWRATNASFAYRSGKVAIDKHSCGNGKAHIQLHSAMVMCVSEFLCRAMGAAVRAATASSDGILHHKFLGENLPRKNVTRKIER